MLPCLMLPLRHTNIVLPSSAVAEIVSYEAPKQVEDQPKWLLGIFSWRGVPIPLTQLETMDSPLAWNGLSSQKDTDSNKSYIAVVNRPKKMNHDIPQEANRYPFFAILLGGAPKLCRAYEEGIKLLTQFPPEDKHFFMEIKIQNDKALIPRLQNLWEMIDALPARLQWFRQIVL